MISLQVIRAIACLMVLYLHFTLAIKRGILPESESLNDILSKGVDIFFIISGFIMVYVQSEKIQPLNFLKKRALRIYPIYFEFTLLALAVWFVNPLMFNNAVGNNTDVFASLLLIPSKPGSLHLINVAWTLCYEVWFYALFALCLLIFRKQYIYGLIFYGTGVSAFIIISQAPTSMGIHVPNLGRFSIIYHPFVLEFICGALYCYFIKHKNKTVLFALGIMLAYLYYINLAMMICILGTISLFEVLKLYEKYFKFPKVLVLIGDASYTLYLTHVLVLNTVRVIFDKIGFFNSFFNKMPNAIWMTIMFTAPILFAVLHYKIVEVRTKEFLLRNFNKIRIYIS